MSRFKLRTTKCMYCSQQVDVTNKDLLKPHTNGGSVKCIGSNLNGTQNDTHYKLINKEFNK